MMLIWREGFFKGGGLSPCYCADQNIFSLIEFPEYLDNTFIATQAPRPNSIKHFWHMIIQAEVLSASLCSR